MENTVVILLVSLSVIIISFYVYETERKLLHMEEKIHQQVGISNTAERKLLQMKEDILIQEVISDRSERKLLQMEEKLLKQEVILDATEKERLNMEKKINKEEVISNIEERLRMVEKLVKEVQILNTAGSVAFSASLSDDSHVDTYEVIKFDTVWVNIGNGYDPDSGVFTAPKSGLYLISYTIRASGKDDQQCSLWVNDEFTVFSAGSSSSSGTLNILMMIHKGDRICITSFEYSKQKIYGNSFSMFSAFLIKKIKENMALFKCL